MKFFFLLLLAVWNVRGADPIRPDARLTPGVALTNVSVQQICRPGYSKSVRNVPETEKRAVFIEYFGAIPAQPGNYEIDHLISLELGGANDEKNLWPETYDRAIPWNARTKDKLEDWMARQVRFTLRRHGPIAASLLLKQYQAEISQDWIAAYQKYIGPQNTRKKTG